MRRFPLAIFPAAFGLALMTMAPAMSAEEAQQQEAAALTVEVVKPTQQQWPETVPASGWLKPWQEAIIAAEIGGLRITDILVDVGSVVTKGEPVAKLLQDTVEADLRKQQAAVETAKANLAKAKADADRTRKLQNTGALSQEDITTKLVSEQTAQADLDSANAALDSIKIQLSQTTILAPDDGLISSRSAQLGNVVSSGAELFRMIRQQRVEWQAEVSARYLSRISVGMTAEIAGPAGKIIKGTVRLIGPTVDSNTGRAIVYIALPPDDRPPEGIYVSGEIELASTSALTVPDTALVFRDGLNYVFTVDADHRVKRVRVDTGRRRDGAVEILSGIVSSDDVVKSGGAFLADNALVTVSGASK
ncbi:efflux RND transporter periplasmic adaptor subunit [Kaistia soli]